MKGSDKMSTKITVFDNINGELKRHHLTKEDLAKYLGIERKTWLNWEKKNDLPTSTILKIADWFGCSLEYLMRDIDTANIN